MSRSDDFTPPETLVDQMTTILLGVDEMGTDFPRCEYRQFAVDVLEAIHAAGLELRARDDVLWANEQGEDAAWGTAG
jgi:hypothetical protein